MLSKRLVDVGHTHFMACWTPMALVAPAMSVCSCWMACAGMPLLLGLQDKCSSSLALH